MSTSWRAVALLVLLGVAASEAARSQKPTAPVAKPTAPVTKPTVAVTQPAGADRYKHAKHGDGYGKVDSNSI